MSVFSHRLRQLRKEKKYTLQELADLMQIPKTTLANYEHGTREPSLDTIQKIAQTLATSSDYLIGLSDNPFIGETENNAHALLMSKQLHWDGIPLDEEDLEPIRKILERIAMYRFPKRKGGEE